MPSLGQFMVSFSSPTNMLANFTLLVNFVIPVARTGPVSLRFLFLSL
uniref:Uncharacterized protein n=1 Tax=Setaria italica TaxID=4555 RepID=K3ZGK2_SETIT